MAAYRHHNRILVDPYASNEHTIVDVQVRSEIESSFRDQYLDLLQDFSVERTRITVSHLKHGERPSGIFVQAQIRSDSDPKTVFVDYLKALSGRRILIGPFASILNDRLHRYIEIRPIDEGLFQAEIILPTEGASIFSVEGVKPFGKDTESLSNRLLGLAPGIASGSPRGIDLDLAMECSTCPVLMTQTIFYSVDTDKSHLSIKDLLLTEDFQVDASADSTTLEIQTNKGHYLTCGTVKENRLYLDHDIDASRLCLKLDKIFKRPLPKYEVQSHIYREDGVANRGTMVLELLNNDDCDADIRVNQYLLPVIEPRWGSLRILSNNREITLDGIDSSFEINNGTSIHLVHRLPANSSLTLSFRYDPSYVAFQQYPGDPNRGFEFSPAKAQFESICTNEGSTLYSDALLIMPSVPDMSMPFNVLSLSCTLYVYLIGSLINLAIRRSSEKVKHTHDPSTKPKSKLSLLKEKVKSKFTSRAGAKTEAEKEKEE